MSKKCEICGVTPIFGNRRSASDKRSRRRWNPNLQKIRVRIDGTVKKMNVCTKCIKNGRIEKP
ncbi:MAG: 50S ribosomal protein L28 [Candidatus Cloacimonadota bacterium]|nr:50S ribosomal protein L28 [Candidatus Cloacimonadota bacterium]